MKSKNLICVDGNTATAYIGYALSEVSCIFPITPSSTMSELIDEWSSENKKNVFGDQVYVTEMQSEAGVAGAVHGSALAGALTSTYTASQGLLLMIPNMYKIAGELLPVVFHVSSRSIASHAINIFGDHSDVMACRQTGFCMLASNNVQEAMDMALIAHISALKASLPFLHFFDGFRTSHEISKIEEISYETIREMIPMDMVNIYKLNAHNPERPKLTGTAQNSDTFMQNREASNALYNNVYDIVSQTMDELTEKTGRVYKPFMYYGATDATDVIVTMCSSADVVQETIDYLNKDNGKYGLVKVHLYRPFNAKAFCECLPKSVKKITVLDKTKEQGSIGEPLYLDVLAALKDNGLDHIQVYGGRYGLGGKDFIPENVVSVFENMQASNPIKHFSVGINDDVTHTSLSAPKNFKGLQSKCYECQFWGLGSDGTISANKSSIKIIGENTNKYIQGYFEYDSKKSGGLTISHLRTSDYPILSSYSVYNADFIAIHNYTYVHKYDVLEGLKKNGTVLLNTDLSIDELANDLPSNFKQHLKDKNAKLFIIPAGKVASDSGLKNRISTIMQACFFKISNVIDYSIADKQMKEFVIKSYSKQGDAIVNSNMNAIDQAIKNLTEVDVNKLIDTKSNDKNNKNFNSKYFKEFISFIEKRKGDQLPVSCFNADGSVPTGTSKFEKRGIANNIPKWVPDKCIQCGQCVLVCPHATIRSKLLTNEQVNNAPEGFASKAAFGVKDAQFKIAISSLDCTGCENCTHVCPSHALEMTNDKSIIQQQAKNWDYFVNLNNEVENPFNKQTVKGIQFEQPYFEFSGACAGCGETPYIKLVTQLFGDELVIANATGCSSIYSSSCPTCPYTVDKNNHGPTWANSLFEDNAEFGYGMNIGLNYRRNQALELLNVLTSLNISDKLKSGINELIKVWDDRALSKEKAKLVEGLLRIELESDSSNKDVLLEALSYKNLFAKKSVWIFGGDGWAYDIGFSGLDHVIASNANVNILVLDTEVYSNTGGQSSKATPLGSVAKFSTDGKKTGKKNLAAIAMSYKNVYVAQISMGANYQQAIEAIANAESYNGPSIVIAYAPCINHGIDMSATQAEMKKAVDSGYWSLFRYDPRNKDNPLSIDCNEPSIDYKEFVKGENRYARLLKQDPDKAEQLFNKAKQQAKDRLEVVKAIAKVK